jgi:aspartyl-tRNA(Asn)/glutamyl-tRNA(Gln) amidotransferase subunit B
VTDGGVDAKAAANWITGEVLRSLKEKGLRSSEIAIWPLQLAGLIRLIANGDINTTTAKAVFADMWGGGDDAATIVDRKGLRQVSDASALAAIVDEVIASEARAVADYRAGNTRAIEALFGKVMGRTKGKANAPVVRKLLTQKLGQG